MEKARQHSALNLRILIGLSVCAVAALGGWYVMREKQPEGPIISSIGGRWIASDLEWTKIDGAWRLGVMLYPYSVRFSDKTDTMVIRALCESVVSQRPGAPLDDDATSQIFRVDLNFATRETANDDWVQSFDRLIPITVRDEDCDVKSGDAVYFPTYPGDLVGWELKAAGLEKHDNGLDEKWVRFELEDGLDLPPRDFPFHMACDAVVQDPLLAVTKSGAFLVEEDGFVSDGTLKIVAQKTNRFGAIFSTLTNLSATFDVVAGLCTQAESEPA